MDKTINWEKTVNLFNQIKSLYALCEETDPELKTNLQPLNEFRAALDHVIRVVAIQSLSEYSEKDAYSEWQKLQSHLRRAFFDICDMVSINYRNQIIDDLEPYSPDEISLAIPMYYSNIKPRMEEITRYIASLRTEKRFGPTDEDSALDEYPKIIDELSKIKRTISNALPSLIELNRKNKIKKKSDLVIPIVSVGVAVLGILFGILF